MPEDRAGSGGGHFGEVGQRVPQVVWGERREPDVLAEDPPHQEVIVRRVPGFLARYPQTRMPVSGRSVAAPIEHAWPFCRAGALEAALTPP